MQEELRHDPGLEYKDIEEGYFHVFPKDTRGRVRGLELLPHACKSVEIAKQSARYQEMEVENTGLRACNAELISRMDVLAGQMEVMQRRWDSQCSSVNHSAVEGLTHVPDRHCQPEASV